MNIAGFTADALGNHNYDRGQDHMARIASAAAFPFLSANTVFADTGKQAPWAKPSMMLTMNCVRVGLIGVTNPEAPALVSPSALANLKFSDPAPAVKAEAANLRRQGAQVVIALFHGGATQFSASTEPYFVKGNPEGPAIDLAKALAPGEIDVLVADHTDVKVRAMINGILVVENLSKGRTYSDIDLHVSPRDGVVYKTARVRPAWNLGVVPDAQVKASIDRYAEALKPIFNEVVGESGTLITRSRGGESLMGNLVTDALRAKYGSQIALQNSGGLRADIDAGPVSYGEVFNVLPFGNQAATLKLPGTAILAALENGVSDFSGSAGRFIRVSGISFTYDQSKPVGQCVVAVFLDQARTQPLDPNTTNTVFTNHFMLTGGDNYTMLAQGTDKVTRDILVNDVIEYVRATGPLNPQIEGRIQVLGK